MAPLVRLFLTWFCLKFTTVIGVVGVLRREQTPDVQPYSLKNASPQRRNLSAVSDHIFHDRLMNEPMQQENGQSQSQDLRGEDNEYPKDLVLNLMRLEVEDERARLKNVFCPAWNRPVAHKTNCTCFDCVPTEVQATWGIPKIRDHLGPLCGNATIEESSGDAVAPGAPSKKKIFFVGFHKTGTTSYTVMFKILGYRVLHGCQWRLGDDPELLKQYDVFTDGCDHNFVRLLELYPDEAHFVYNTREMRSWMLSQLRQNSEDLKSMGTLGRKVEEIAQTTVSAVTKRRWGCEVEVSEAYVQRAIAQRLDYEKRLFQHFQEKQKPILVLDIAGKDKFGKLAKFIGFPKPSLPLRNAMNKIRKNNITAQDESISNSSEVPTEWKDWVDKAVKAERLRRAPWVEKAPWYQSL